MENVIARSETHPPELTLQDVRTAIQQRADLSDERRRELLSALSRAAKLFKEDLSRVALDIPALAARFETISPVANGISWKSLANVRSGVLSAIGESKLRSVRNRGRGTELNEAWRALRSHLNDRRSLCGTERLAHYCADEHIDPEMVDDSVIAAFIDHVRSTTFHKKPHQLHRNTTIIWNEIVARLPHLGLRPLAVPPSRSKSTQLKWSDWTESFRLDAEKYMAWCGTDDLFGDKPRERVLSAGTIGLLRSYINAAATALVKSGVAIDTIQSLAVLVSLDAARTILQYRYSAVGKRENQYNDGVGRALVQIAKEWVHLDGETLAELKRRVSKLPRKPLGGMTDRNRAQLRQFDDPKVLERLVRLPARLWRKAMREPNPTWRTLATAQAALAIGMLTHIPIRLQNLSTLEFDRNLFLKEGKGAISKCEFAAEDVKNDLPLAYDIQPDLARMMIEYRDTFAPRIIGCRPSFVFINQDGSLKLKESVRSLIKTNLARHAGIELHPHAFRHLAGKVILDAAPGAHESVKQLLGHKSIRTTVNFYTGVDTRRAGRHYQTLLAQVVGQSAKPGRTEKKDKARRQSPAERLGD